MAASAAICVTTFEFAPTDGARRRIGYLKWNNWSGHVTLRDHCPHHEDGSKSCVLVPLLRQCGCRSVNKPFGGDGTMVLLLPFLQIVSREGGLHGVYCIFHMSVFLYNPLLKVLVENNGSRDILCWFSSLDHLPLRSTNIANFCQLWLRGRAVP